MSVGTGKGYKEPFVSQIKGRNSTAVTVLKIFQAAPLPWRFYLLQRDRRRGNGLFSILDFGGGQRGAIKEGLCLPLAKFQGAYLSSRFPVFETYGIHRMERRI